VTALFGSGGLQLSWVCLEPRKDEEPKTQAVTAKLPSAHCPAAAPALPALLEEDESALLGADRLYL